MRLKRRAATLVVGLLLGGLVGPWATPLAAAGELSRGEPTEALHDPAHDDENAGEQAENPHENSGDAVQDSDGTAHHDEGDESGGHGACAVVIGPVSVCLDELKN